MKKTNYGIIKETHNDSNYVAVNGFKNSRRTNNLTELLSFYVDLDIKDTHLFECIYSMYEHTDDSINPNVLINNINNEYKILINQICKEKNIPLPTKINYSGNGYHVYWDIKAHSEAKRFDEFYGASFVQKDAYVLINKALVEVFKELGADKRATDVARLLRETNTLNQKSMTICRTIFSRNDLIEFKQMADNVLKYAYEEVKEYKKTTKKQKEFLKKNNLPMTKDKFVAQKRINQFIKEDNKATVKQVNYLLKLGAKEEEVESINSYEASELINKLKPQSNYICNMLDKLYKTYKIKEGNRSMFYFYYSIGMRREDKTIDDVLTKLNELNKRLGLPISELESIANSAFRENVSLNIKKSTIFDDLGVSGKNISRSKKSALNDKYERFKANLSKYSKMSFRKVAEELEISKSTITNFKKRLKEEISRLRELKEEQKQMMVDFINNLFVNNQEIKLIDQVDFEEIIKCPQKIE